MSPGDEGSVQYLFPVMWYYYNEKRNIRFLTKSPDCTDRIKQCITRNLKRFKALSHLTCFMWLCAINLKFQTNPGNWMEKHLVITGNVTEAEKVGDVRHPPLSF